MLRGMRGTERKPSSRSCLSRVLESGALICGVGFFVSLGVAGWQPISDWRHNTLKSFTEYLRLTALLSGPFLLGVFICGTLLRKTSREAYPQKKGGR